MVRGKVVGKIVRAFQSDGCIADLSGVMGCEGDICDGVPGGEGFVYKPGTLVIPLGCHVEIGGCGEAGTIGIERANFETADTKGFFAKVESVTPPVRFYCR